MARIEAGEGNKGREREWLARAVRGPARSRLDRRRLYLRPLATGLAGHRRGRCLRVEGAGRCHRPRRRDIADRGKPRAARAAGAVEGRGSGREEDREGRGEEARACRAACGTLRRWRKRASGDHRPGHAGHAARAAWPAVEARALRGAACPRRSWGCVGRSRRKPGILGAPAGRANPLVSGARPAPLNLPRRLIGIKHWAHPSRLGPAPFAPMPQ